MAIFSPLRVIKKRITKDTACPITVAHAAPLTPKPQIKMRIGSRTTFNIAPVTIPYIAKLAFPCNRIWLFKVSDEVKKGAPSRMTCI